MPPASPSKASVNHNHMAEWPRGTQKNPSDIIPMEKPVVCTGLVCPFFIAYYLLALTNPGENYTLENQFNKQNEQINLHKTQLSSNEERFRLLESTCYNGKLIWKVTDYERKKREAVEGRVVSIYSQHFYTSRCGYRLCARAYLNGDGSGKGNYLSLYFVVMKGEFDSLLSWPFKQKVTLMILDQSGKKNNIVDVFKSDPHSSSFKRPEGEMNIASGCPRFVSHNQLENPKNGCYIKDDTLFIKVVVDLTDLEEL